MSAIIRSRLIFENTIKNKGGIVLGTYAKNNVGVLIQCNMGHQWSPTPSDIKKGTWCPSCRLDRTRIEFEKS